MLPFFPSCNEENLKSPPFLGTYYEKLQEPGVMDKVCRNQALTEPFGKMLDQALLNFWFDLRNADAFSQQENDEVEDELATVINDLLDEQDDTDEEVSLEESSPILCYITPILITDNKRHSMIRLMTDKQYELFNIVYSWENDMQKVNQYQTILI